MAGITKRERYNRNLMNYKFFDSKADAMAFIKDHRLRKYVLSSNLDGTCWTLHNKNLWKY